MKKKLLEWTRERRERWEGAVEDALVDLAMKGDERAEQVLERPWVVKRLANRLRFSKLAGELGDGQLLDSFERLVEFLLSKADEILALIMKIIPLFVKKG